MITPDADYLNECFDYCNDTGLLKWKSRPNDHFGTLRGMRVFNNQKAGKYIMCTSLGYYVVRLTFNKLEKKYLVHKIIWKMINGRDVEFIDHIDGNGLNNRISNLREATRIQNNRNARLSKNNTTGYKGVTYCKKSKKYRAQIVVNGQFMNLGSSLLPEEAHRYYCDAAKNFHGVFANFG